MIYSRLNLKQFPITSWDFKMHAATWDRLLNLWLHKLEFMRVAEKFSLYQFNSQAALSPEEFVKILPYNSYINILAKK